MILPEGWQVLTTRYLEKKKAADVLSAALLAFI